MARHSFFSRVVSLTFLFLLSASFAPAQESTREVVARLLPGTIVMPPNMQSCTLDQIQSYVPDVMAALSEWDVQVVEIAFPGFVPADTLAIASRTGETVRVTNWSDVYVFVLLTEQDAQSLISDLVALPHVVYAESNFIEALPAQCPLEPDDPLFDVQWGLRSFQGEGVPTVL